MNTEVIFQANAFNIKENILRYLCIICIPGRYDCILCIPGRYTCILCIAGKYPVFFTASSVCPFQFYCKGHYAAVITLYTILKMLLKMLKGIFQFHKLHFHLCIINVALPFYLKQCCTENKKQAFVL